MTMQGYRHTEGGLHVIPEAEPGVMLPGQQIPGIPGNTGHEEEAERTPRSLPPAANALIPDLQPHTHGGSFLALEASQCVAIYYSK